MGEFRGLYQALYLWNARVGVVLPHSARKEIRSEGVTLGGRTWNAHIISRGHGGPGKLGLPAETTQML